MVKKILILDSFCDLCMGGVAQFLVNTLSNMDLSDYEVDLLTPGRAVSPIRKAEFERLVDNWIVLNINIDINTSKFQKIIEHIQFAWRLKKVFRQKQYDIVHVNGGSLLYHVIVLRLAKKYHIPHRLSHSHSVSPYKIGPIRKHLQNSIANLATELLACTSMAAQSYFGENASSAHILQYGIDIDRFIFDGAAREEYRKKYDIPDDAYVIGHVGRFDAQKNHQFLVKIFQETAKIDPNVRLMMVGEGALQEGIRERFAELGLSDRVIFAGATAETEKYYCAMDLFILPSIHEGLGIVNIEAQTSGLSCIISDRVPPEADASGRVEFLPLGDAQLWAKHILEHKNEKPDRADAWRAVAQNGYSVEGTARGLQNVYDGMN